VNILNYPLKIRHIKAICKYSVNKFVSLKNRIFSKRVGAITGLLNEIPIIFKDIYEGATQIGTEWVIRWRSVCCLRVLGILEKEPGADDLFNRIGA